MNEYNVTIILKGGNNLQFKDVAHIEFNNDFIIVQFWDTTCETIDTKQIDSILIIPFYNIL